MTLAHRILAAATCIGALVAVAGAGCSRRDQVDRDGYAERSFDQGATDRSGVGTTMLTGADVGSISSDTATERIMVARCTRETACNNIGTDKHFVSSEACARELRAKVGADISPANCPYGIDIAATNNCVEAIRNESCNNPGDTISRLDSCRTSALCVANRSNR